MENSQPHLNHEILGQIQGSRSENGQTVQYRGIKFAEVPGRWKDPVLYSQRLSQTVYDATKFGPSCPQKDGGLEFDVSLVGDVELPHHPTSQSELECLNLVVTVPHAYGKVFSDLPVIAWVHGGGFSIGSNSWPQYDLSNIVELSATIGKPVIGVSLNYRLGIFGFLASDEMGIRGNYGFKDQACAFSWIHKHIRGFGGDPTKVMAFGESAGAISISSLLVAGQPLFSRAILMSGDTTLRRIRTMSWHNNHYDETCRLLGLENLPDQERRQKLLTMKAERIVEKLPLFQHWSPALDGRYFKREVDLGMLSAQDNETGKPNWCKDIVVGDVFQDGTILKSRLLDDPMAMVRVHEAADRLLDTSEREKLFKAYNLTNSFPPSTQYSGILQLASELRFYLPVLKIFEGLADDRKLRSYRCHFHQPNPIDGTFKGLACHELDVAFLLQNFRHYMPQSSVKLGLEMATKWIQFANNVSWSSPDSEKKVLVIGPEDRISLVSEVEYDLNYRDQRGALLQEIGWQKCFQLGEMLQGCS